MIFLYEPKLLKEGQRCDALIQQDYIHSCGVVFASDVNISQPLYVWYPNCNPILNHLLIQRELQRQFRAGYGAPNHFKQPWFADYDYPRVVFEMA